MASVKISQLPVGGSISTNDEFPVSRGGLETYRILANQIVTAGGNVGSAAEVYQTSDTTIGSTTLRFRSLSGVGEGIQVVQDTNTVNISISGQNPSKNVFTGTGSQVNFALTNASSRNVNNYRVDIDGVLQEPGQTADYYLDSSNLVFTTPPPSGSKVVVVSNNLLPLVEAVPANNSITNAMFTDGCINTPELSSGAVTTDKIALSAVTTQKIANSAITAEKMSGGQTGNAPVYGCRAWVNFSGVLLDNSPLNAPPTTTISVSAGNTFGHWDSVGWSTDFVGVRYKISSINGVTGALLGGVDVANAGIQIVEFISSSRVRFRFLSGQTPTSNQSQVGNNTSGAGGFTYQALGIREAGNVSSIFRNNTGDYTINFTIPMPDANYATSGFAGNSSGNAAVIQFGGLPSVSATRVSVVNSSFVGADRDVSIAIFR